MAALKEVQKLIDDNGIRFVRFEFGDMYGIARSKIVPVRHFKDKCQGLTFPIIHFAMDPQGGMAEQTPYSEEASGTDSVWYPDLETFRIVPWCRDTAQIFVEPTLNHKPLMSFPRYIARKQLEKLADLGITLSSTNEYEFYLVDRKTRKPVTEDISMRSTLRNYADPELIEELLTFLPFVGVDVDTSESKYGPGQMQITYKPEFGIVAADNAHVFKTAVKELAQKRGYVASFMTKPWPTHCTSSGHFTHSLWDLEGKRNLMYDAKTTTGLSELGQHWIAGILTHAAAISVLLAPTINCLKRYRKFNFTATNATWGIDNSTCALRMKINGDTPGTYLENRMGASGSNPYLCMAAVVAAGIDGIKRKLPLPDKIMGSAFEESNLPSGTIELPSNLTDATKAFVSDGVIRDAFGAEFRTAFLALKRHEMKCEREADEKGDKDWERQLFFDYL